mmetsp:Transcript_15421/g.31303  ORF Transcript_15421/g.31303 Transcript_15421/m.31303 type:complete len:105 (-) Transcript_15421:17-331(-)
MRRSSFTLGGVPSGRLWLNIASIEPGGTKSSSVLLPTNLPPLGEAEEEESFRQQTEIHRGSRRAKLDLPSPVRVRQRCMDFSIVERKRGRADQMVERDMQMTGW